MPLKISGSLYLGIAEVIFRVKISCITPVDGIILWPWLVNYVAMLLVVFQLSRDIIGYEDS